MQDQDRDYLVAMLQLLGYTRVTGTRQWGFDQYKISYEQAKLPAKHPNTIIRHVLIYQNRTHVTGTASFRRQFVGRHDEVVKWLKSNPPTGEM